LNLTNAIKLGAATATIDVTSNNKGTLNLSGPIDLNGSVLKFAWDSSPPFINMQGVISGAGGIIATGSGGDIGLALGGNNTFTGPVSGNGGINCCSAVNGKVALSNTGNTYSGASQFSLNAGGTLRVLADNTLSPNSPIVLGGQTGGVLNMGAFSATAASFAG